MAEPLKRPMKRCCIHENSFGTYSCCKEHDGKPCRLVIFSPAPLEEKTHGLSQRQNARMEIAATVAVQTIGAPIMHSMFVRAVPFPLVPTQSLADACAAPVSNPKRPPGLIVLPKNGG